MTPDALLDELAIVIGPREARWVLEEAARDELGGEERATVARALAARRLAGEPIQYVLGHWPFRTLDLLVGPAALIPRPETEELAGRAIERVLERGATASVCDLGCGTGAIALSVAVESAAAGVPAAVHATDVSHAALDLARRNAVRCGVADVGFHVGSWYEALPPALAGGVDVLCANPPYVSAAERQGLDPVLDFEPELALVAPDGSDGTPGLGHVEAVIRDAAAWLARGGILLVEHGATQGDAACALAARSGLEVHADHLDLAGLPRVLEARRLP